MENVLDLQIHSIIISDHAPISVTFIPLENLHKTKPRRFNNSLLKDEEFITEILEKMSDFFTINIHSGPSTQIVWEAFKATCRGWIISYSTAKKEKKMLNKKRILMTELKILETQHMLDPKNIRLRNSLLLMRSDLQAILPEETSFALFQIRKKYFKAGEKSGKMLALQLKQMENKHSIPAIYNCDGSMVCDQKQMNSAFQEFYSNLYKSEYHANEEDMNNFFNDIPLPTLKIEEREKLETCSGNRGKICH